MNQNKSDAIKRDIAKLEEKLNQIESGERSNITDLEKYTDKQKIDFFDKTYKFAIDLLEEFENSGYNSEANDTWAFEHTMQILNLNAPHEFWKYWNSLSN